MHNSLIGADASRGTKGAGCQSVARALDVNGLRRPVSLDILAQRVIHARLPSFAGRLEVLDYLNTVSNRDRDFGRQLLRSALARKAHLPFGPIRRDSVGIVGIIWTLGVSQLFQRGCDGRFNLLLAKGRGL